MTLTAIARTLNDDKTPTATGRIGAWYPTTIRQICLRKDRNTNE